MRAAVDMIVGQRFADDNYDGGVESTPPRPLHCSRPRCSSDAVADAVADRPKGGGRWTKSVKI